MEVCQPSPSQPPESSSFPSCSLESPLSSPSGPHLPNSVSLSQSPTENQVVKGILRYPIGRSLIDDLSPRKMAKVREVLCSLDIKVYSKRKNSGSTGNGWEGHKFMRRLQYVKAKLKEWNKFSFGELNEKKKSILNDLANFDAIEQAGGLTSKLLSQRASRKGEIEELILREEIHWRQKARVKWVKEGDCNSKFFHKVANGRRNRKYIKELENERGLVLKNVESITEEILLYFEKLYASPTGESWSVEDRSPI
ncbi:hypothetical protein CK203_017644 [Vitis vinifera]|uniref:Uncharacterized protein n=1 Tax=Vitis vinifera TaxID=29760 RepID=A0A438JH87_VITVI|nr:hypothetical protein CK203_017644 [Vitis vinifera]